MGGDEGGGDGGFAERQQVEEHRKAALRGRINQLYGFDADIGAAPTREQFTSAATPASYSTNGDVTTEIPGTAGGFDEAGFNKALAEFNSRSGTSKKARNQMAAEETKLAGATRDFHSEDLRHTYDRAKRNNTFALADRGLLGGSAQIDTEAELNRDNTLGATRLEDEVRAAVASLKNMREGERLNAIQLANAGAGEDAVAGAQAGLSRALANASSTRKASIAGDLFTAGADSVAAGQAGSAGPLALQQYRNSLKTFFGNSGGGGSGRVTATG